jgi:hypothetical protein
MPLVESKQWKQDTILDEVRELERDLKEDISAAGYAHENCQGRVQKLEKAIESDLFKELDVDLMYRLRELADSVRVKHKLLVQELGKARQAADECDQMLTEFHAARLLKKRDEQLAAEARLPELLAEMQSIHIGGVVLCNLLQEQAQDQLSIFERLKR